MFDIELFEVEAMRVLVIGATGYIGRVVVERLIERGHEPVAFVRPAADGSRRVPDGVPELHGDLADPASIGPALTPDLDAVVHAGQLTGDVRADLDVIKQLAAAAPLVYVSGVWVLGQVDGGDEESPVNPISLVAHRPEVERLVLDGGGAVIRPGVVHGRGGGLVAMLRGWAAERGAGVYVSAGGQAPGWPFVHVDDLADLIVTIAGRRGAGVYHAVAEETVPVAEVAAAAAASAGATASAVPWPVEEAAVALGGGFAEALALSQRVGAARTRADVGWNPSRPGVLDDLA